MDLMLMILRFLFGVPAEGSEVEPIAVRVDGRTSSGRQWLAPRHGGQNAIGSSKLQHHGEPVEVRLLGLLKLVCRSLQNDPRSKIRSKENSGSFRN